MKVRSDFVSNSSSSSFIIKKQDDLKDFFIEFKEIIHDLDEVIYYFENSETALDAFNYLLKNKDIKYYFEKQFCNFNKENNTIRICAVLFNHEKYSDDLISAISYCDKVECFLIDNFGNYSCRLYQLATLCEYKGFDIDTSNMKHDNWVQMKEDLNETKN